MPSIGPHRTVASRPSADSAATICVVDPAADDYRGWHDMAEKAGVQIHIVASAAEALRLARSGAVDLWVINSDLPGLSGLDVCRMLKSRNRHARVVVVAESYSADLERDALAAGATMFVVKPARHDWFAGWLSHVDTRPRPVRG